MKKLTLLILLVIPFCVSAQTKNCCNIVDSLKQEIKILKAQLAKCQGNAPADDTTEKVYKSNTGTKKSSISGSSSTSHQCHATTKKGYRCSRMVTNGYNCWQHGG